MGEIKLNEKQRQAVIHEGSPLLIIAGAGTGKTTVITERIKWLIQEKGLKPDQVLALTFTEKAAQEMEERVDVALPMGVTQTWIMTFHGFCERVLRAEAIQIGLDPGFNILSEAEMQIFVRDHLFEFDLDYYRPKGNPTKFIGGLITHFSRLRDEAISPSEYREWLEGWNVGRLQGSETQTVGSLSTLGDESKAQTPKNEMTNEFEKYKELVGAYQKYEELKIKHSVMDFADLISNTLKLFRERPNVLKTYRERFKHVLIDEFQDTNYAQNQLAVMLAGDDQAITVVADDDQSIYRWRGAAVYNVLGFREQFANTTILTLNENYRSVQPVLDHSYQLIQNNNPDRLEVKAEIDKRLTSQGPALKYPKGRALNLIHEETVEDEAEAVAHEIENLVENARRIRPSEPMGFSDIAILVRANNHAEPFTRALARHGIPFQFLGPGRLFRQAEIKDLIAYAQVLTDFQDSKAMYRVLSMPTLTFKGRDVQWFVTQSKRLNLPLFRVLEEFVRVSTSDVSKETSSVDSPFTDHGIEEKEVKKFIKLITMMHRHLERIDTASPGEILYYFLEDTGQLVKMRDPQNEYEARRTENISAFFTRIKAYEVQHPEGKMNDFVEYLEFLIDAGESPLASQIDWSETDAVKILTVHSAKGLEFDVVFMVNLVNLRFPSINRKDQVPLPEEIIKEPEPTIDPHIGEERRLFYVGMTRAKRKLYLTAARFYHDSATARPKKLSPFVEEALGEKFEGYKVQVNKLQDGENTDKTNRRNDEHENLELKEIDGFKTKEEVKEQRLPLPQKHEVNYLSYSQIETFETCPLHYKLDYMIKVPKLPSGPLTFGTAIHESLRDVYSMLLLGQVERRIDPMYERVLEFYNARWSPIGFKSKEEELSRYKDGKKILKNFLEYDLDQSFDLLELEKPFTFNITRDLKIGGRIDRINRVSGGKLEIIDYKTGQMPRMQELQKGIKGLQLSIYALAITNEEVMGERLENLLFSFHYLEAGERITIERTEEDLATAKEKILEVRSQIEKSTFECSHSYICEHGCEYSLFCD